MFTRITRTLILALLATTLASTAALASVISVQYALGSAAYDLENSFLSGAVTSQTETFESFSTTPSYSTTAPLSIAVGTLYGRGYVGDDGSRQAGTDEYAAYGDNYWSNGDVGSLYDKGALSVDITTPNNAVGFYGIDMQDIGGTVMLSVTSGGATEVLNLRDLMGSLPSGTLAYFTILADSQITNLGFGEAGSNDGYAIDNLSTAQTPIPGAAWLFGSGLFGLVGLRRRFGL